MTSLYFFGSDKYSAVVLAHLLTLDSSYSLVVVTDIKSPPNPVESLAQTKSLSLIPYTPNLTISPNSLGLAASFPHLFSPALIDSFHNQLYNLHPSLLPQYRNVAPVPYALAMGDTETGITLQKIDSRIDHGQIIAQSKESILPDDTTPTLLTRLFKKGSNLFVQSLQNNFVGEKVPTALSPLIFTRKLSRESGYLEWDVAQKLLQNSPLQAEETANQLIKLRLTLHPSRKENILLDLIRALSGYEKVWTNAPTSKGTLPISFTQNPTSPTSPLPYVLLPGKPRPISYSDFTQYYLRQK